MRLLTSICLFILSSNQVLAKDYPKAPEETREFELDLQIDRHGTISQYKYRLNWGSAESTLQTISVIDGESNGIIQTIKMPPDIKLAYNDIFVNGKPAQGFRDKILDLVDYNFDNYGDLRILKSWPINLSTKGYYVFIFHSIDSIYKLNRSISDLPNPIPHSKSYRIETSTLGGWGGGEFTKTFYSIDQKGTLTAQSRWNQKIKDPIRMSFQREIRVRVNGTLTRICNLLIHSAKEPLVIWGNKKKCAKYRYFSKR